MDSPLPGPADVAAVGVLVFGLLYAGALLTEDILTAQAAQSATVSAIPTATATTTTTSPPIAVPRRHPNQTCDDKRLEELEASKKVACQGFPGKQCNAKPKVTGQYPCSAIIARAVAMRACAAARQKVQDECFKNGTDPGHAQQIQGFIDGALACEALRAVNCAPGHPMSGL